MNIDPEVQQHFDTVKQMYLDAVTPLLPGYEIDITMTDLSEENESDTVVGDDTDFDPSSYGMDIKFVSHKYGKKIEFSLSDGRSLDSNGYYHALRFLVRNMSGEDSSDKNDEWFNLQDYFTHNNISEDIDDFFDVDNVARVYPRISNYIAKILLLLAKEDIQHILFSRDWITVPHDKSMYF